MSAIYRTPKTKTVDTVPAMTTVRASAVVDFIVSQYHKLIPRTCLALQNEVHKSVGNVATPKLIQWLNVIANILRNNDGKMVMTEEKAKTIEFIIAG